MRFRWLGPAEVEITAPYQATYEAFAAGFGPAVTVPLSGALVQVNDGVPNGGREGCLPLLNGAALSGNIAVIRRGTCEFGSKALRAQQAGAIGVMLFNNQGGDTLLSPGLGADGALVTVPVSFISENNGNVLSAALANGPGAGRLLPRAAVGADRDSDFDAGIIAHEYGHGLSNRLTGTGSNNIAFQLVIDGMKIQPCRPSIVQARNAIIAADVANPNTGAERCTVWRAFGRRGMGLSASSGLNTSRSDQIEAFDVPPDCAQFTVTPTTAGAGTGTIAPASPQAVASQTLLPFTFTPTGC